MNLKPACFAIAMLALSVPAVAQVAATVNGKPIPKSRIDVIVKQLVAQGKQTDTPQLREEIRKDLVTREVVIQEADKQGMGTRPEVKATIDNARQGIIINALMMDYVRKNPISDAAIRSEYDKYKTRMGDKEYRIHHILVKTEDEAKGIIAKLKTGSKFEDLAKAQSLDESGAKGGDLGYVSPGFYEDEFAKAAVALKKGAVTETPVKTQYGYHVIKTEDSRPTNVPAFEALKQQIGEAMMRAKVQQYREELMKKATIK